MGLHTFDQLPNPLPCEEDDSAASLQRQRRELAEAAATGVYRRRRVERVPVSPTQVGFSQVALLRVLDHVQYSGSQEWVRRFTSVRTALDAALFMVDAKLKLRYDLDPPSRTDGSGSPDQGPEGTTG